MNEFLKISDSFLCRLISFGGLNGAGQGLADSKKHAEKIMLAIFRNFTYLGHPKTWKIFFQETVIDIVQGSLNYLFLGGDQTTQIYGKFEGFPFYNALFGLVI